jgi:hypothetical protein
MEQFEDMTLHRNGGQTDLRGKPAWLRLLEGWGGWYLLKIQAVRGSACG